MSAQMTARLAARRAARPQLHMMALGPVLGLLLITAVDTPSAATRLAVQMMGREDPDSERNALAIMRTIGDRGLLLRLCYDATGRPSGPLSALVALNRNSVFAGESFAAPSTSTARMLYYQMTGEPFNTVAPPFRRGPWAFADGFDFDEDQGGAQVGGRVRGLSLASSRIDGSLDAEDAIGYLEWILEFTNSGNTPSEARATIALPPGAVVSRVTLWVAGEEREAVFTGRAEARAAYERVVRHEQRDPLLVTTSGGDRVLIQAFPVPIGGSLRLRIGITAPLDVSTGDQSAFVLPAIVDRNFSIRDDLRHNVWIEGDGLPAATPPGFALGQIKGPAFRVSGALSDETLTRTRPRLAAQRVRAPSVVYTPAQTSPDAAQGVIVQRIAQAQKPRPDAIMFVLDGSRRAEGGAEAIRAAVAVLPNDMIAGLAIAADTQVLIAPAPLDAAHRTRIDQALNQQRFRGGQDNTESIVAAINALEPHADATIIWVHGPQPVEFRRNRARLEQILARSERLPRLLLYPISAGPNQVLSDHPWFWRAHTVAWSGAPEIDLAAVALSLRGDLRWSATQTAETASMQVATRGSSHIARLWANTRVQELANTQLTDERKAAIALARAYAIVTPVSGAVVLETNKDYERAELEPPTPGDVPTVPEPEVYLLLAVAAMLFGWRFWRQRRELLA